MGNISNCCLKKKKNKGMMELDTRFSAKEPDTFVFDKGGFKNKKDEKFKDNYKIGQSMGCSFNGEVRKC